MRRVLPLLLVILAVIALVVVKATQIGALVRFGKAAQVAGPPPEYVSEAKATEESWESTLDAVGSVETVKGVTLGNDAPGVVKAIHFESGDSVDAGKVLVELDASVERAQLESATARRELAQVTLARTKKLVEAGTLAKSQLDNDQSVFDAAQADCAQLAAQIARKTVRAPFAGKLGIRQVNLGQYLPSGTAITVLESPEVHAIDFTLPQQDLDLVTVGDPVRMSVTGVSGMVDGKIDAIDPKIDPVARAIKLRALSPDEKRVLRPGMFVNVAVVLPKKQTVVAIPATALVHAPYGDSVFVIEQKTGPDGKPAKYARQQFVRAGLHRGDFIAIEQGVQAGDDVVTAGAFKLRNGARIEINDTVKENPQTNPHPENR